METLTTDTMDRPLTAADRCDRCGAQAYVRVTLASGELLFCAHHGNEHLPALRAKALSIHDETAKLSNPAPEYTAPSYSK